MPCPVTGDRPALSRNCETGRRASQARPPAILASCDRFRGEASLHTSGIHALNSFKGEDENTWGCVLKVADMSMDDLIAVVRPLVVKILDVRWCERSGALGGRENGAFA